MDKLATTKRNFRKSFGPLQPFPKPPQKKTTVEKKSREFTLQQVLNQHCKTLKKKFRFSLAELSVIIQIFWKVSDRKMILTEDAFKKFMCLTFNYQTKGMLCFRGYERIENPHHMELVEFVRIFWTMLRGSLEEKARLTFEIYDRDGHGVISPENLMHFTKDLVEQQGVFKDERQLHYIEFFLKNLTKERTVGITFEYYLKFVKENNYFMECFAPVWPDESYINVMRNLLLR